MWGEHERGVIGVRLRRTIPTRVGRTTRRGSPSTTSSDHPHACGENALAAVLKFREGGPSPRVWGEQVQTVKASDKLRTIPTRVGRTIFIWVWSPPRADHPHACGENRVHHHPAHFSRGPSPRVWGEQLGYAQVKTTPRTIPTRVGRTLPAPGSLPPAPDHPHACGENSTGRTPRSA